MHGKGDRGHEANGDNPVVLAPEGNAAGWGGRQWLYEGDAGYLSVRDVVAKTIDDAACTTVTIHGFSNGGAAATKLFCRGETFGGRVRAYVIDDPVPDHVIDRCVPPAHVKVALYWTGALTQAVEGAKCADLDWTCEGGDLRGIDAFAKALGTTLRRDGRTKHEPLRTPLKTEW